jgi:asparagine synthase (glutamine-hydrolysing)
VCYARAVGAHLGLTVSEIPPALPALEWYAENARHIRNIPGFPNGEFHSSVYGMASRRGERAILSGAGGDQFLIGSPRYYSEELLQGHFSTLVHCFAEDVRTMGTARTLRRFVRYGLAPLTPAKIKRLWRWGAGQSREEAYWLSPHLRELLKARRQRIDTQPALATERQTQLRLLHVLDRAFDTFGQETMETIGSRHALERRRPFYGTAYVEFALATPERLRSIGGRIKFIHCESLRGFLPEDVRLRKTKARFTRPFEAPLQPLREYFTSQLPLERPEWFDKSGMGKLWRCYRERQPNAGAQSVRLWCSLGAALAMGMGPN